MADHLRHALDWQAELHMRITAALADLDQVADVGTHYDGCWRDPGHGGCLAARIRRTLTGKDPR